MPIDLRKEAASQSCRMSRRSKERTIGINVHLDDTVLNSGSDLSLGRSRSSVEDEEAVVSRIISLPFARNLLLPFETRRVRGEDERTWGEGSQTSTARDSISDV